MVARIWCWALAMGVLVGCYDLPQPECGFACGPAGACPSDYSCNMAVNRCELSGTAPSCEPALRSDAGTDAVRDTPDDFTPPTVISTTPDPDASGVPVTATISATFSEPMLGATISTATMIVERSGIQISGSVSYEPSSLTVTFQPFNTLQPGTPYTVFLLSDISDLAGNQMAVPEVWRFQTLADTTPPTVTARLPAVDAMNVGVGANIFVDFSEQVFGVSASSFTLSQGATPVAGTVNNSTGPPARATFTQSTQLAPNTTYTVNVGAPIEDTSFNPLVPISWMFTTGPDLQAPIVVTRTPPPASAAVPVTAQVTASFDEPVINLSTTSFTLTPQGGSPVAATVSYTAATRTATLTPDLQLAPNTLHTAILTSAITDAAGNPLTPAPVGWMFTTAADTIGPRVALTTPADLATDVPTSSTIAVQFDEPVQNVSTTTFTLNGGAITGTIALSAGNTIATFTPDAALPASATISVELTIAITDASTNALAAPVMFSFMTAP